MNRMLVFFLLAVSLLMLNVIPATAETKLDYGVSVGYAKGDNVKADRENWVPTFRAHVGFDLIPMLYTEFSGRYAALDADYNNRGRKGYSTSTAILDWRLVFSPLHQGIVEPYFAAGLGLSKDLDDSDEDMHALVPFAAGLRIELVPRLMLDVSGTYDLLLTDDFAVAERVDKKNPITGGEQDSFFGWMVGLTVVPERVDHEALALAEKERMEREAEREAMMADPDGDGLPTGDEMNTYNTDPMMADTDGDGLSDSAELLNHKSDPVDPDTDKDGLHDGQEVNKFKTSPTNADTDGDGLNDGAEVSLHKTDPTLKDTDSDGLSDGEEVNAYKTDPLVLDTDGGSMRDGAEIAKGLDPLDPEDDKIELRAGTSMVLKGINFELSSAKLTANSIKILEDAYEAMMSAPEVKVLIVGHSDSSGNDAFNMELSKRRAQSVKNWLVERGIAESRLMTEGKGETQPIADNGTAEGRAKNRRIEFVVK